MLPVRAVSQALVRRGTASVLLAPARAVTAASPRMMATAVPRLGTEAQMQAEAIEQIRARVNYQKELMKAKGHGIDEEVAEMWRWVSITFWVAIPVCVLSSLYSIFFDEHAHRVDGELPEYMHVRSKEFPWECGECDLFDLSCWKKCRAEKA